MAEEAGTIRLRGADSEEIQHTPPLISFRTEAASMNAKAYPVGANATALPRMVGSGWIDEGSKLVIEMLADAADTVESEESNGNIPIILKHKKTGVVEHTNITIGDVGNNLTTFAATADVVNDTSNFKKLGHFIVPDGYMMRLDAGKPFHVFIGDDT